MRVITKLIMTCNLHLRIYHTELESVTIFHIYYYHLLYKEIDIEQIIIITLNVYYFM